MATASDDRPRPSPLHTLNINTPIFNATVNETQIFHITSLPKSIDKIWSNAYVNNKFISSYGEKYYKFGWYKGKNQFWPCVRGLRGHQPHRGAKFARRLWFHVKNWKKLILQLFKILFSPKIDQTVQIHHAVSTVRQCWRYSVPVGAAGATLQGLLSTHWDPRTAACGLRVYSYKYKKIGLQLENNFTLFVISGVDYRLVILFAVACLLYYGAEKLSRFPFFNCKIILSISSGFYKYQCQGTNCSTTPPVCP